VEKLVDVDKSGLFMEVGTGKTWVAIYLMAQRYLCDKSEHVVVISKNGVQHQWVEEQIPEHMSDLIPRHCLVYQNTKTMPDKIADLLAKPGLKILAINIESVNSAELLLTRFLKAAKGAGSIYIDESHLIKNLQAKRTKASKRLARLCRFRMILTGTPIAKGVEDLWSQFKLLGLELIGYKRKDDFISDFCETVLTPYGREITGYKNLDKLYTLMAPFTYRITSDEALDLPPRNYIEVPFELTDEQRRLIKEVREELAVKAKSAEVQVSTGGLAMLVAQQIASGFMKGADGKLVEFANPRLDALRELVDQLEGKVIVWCRFNYDVEVVWKVLRGRAVHYFGGTKPEDRQLAIKQFMDPASGIDYLVASQAAAGTGLNLQGLCHTNIYYTNSFNAIDRWQSEGRTWRDGAVKPVTYFDLVARRSPDKYLLKNLRDKRSVSDMTLDDFRQALEGV